MRNYDVPLPTRKTLCGNIVKVYRLVKR